MSAPTPAELAQLDAAQLAVFTEQLQRLQQLRTTEAEPPATFAPSRIYAPPIALTWVDPDRHVANRTRHRQL